MLALNQIHYGDCYKLIKDIPDKYIDLIHTDPPYSFDESGSGGCFGKKERLYHKELESISEGIQNSLLEEFCKKKKKINIYIWCSKNQLKQYINFFESRGASTELLTWHKTNPIPTCNNKYLSDTEYCLFFREKSVPLHGKFETKRKYYIGSSNVEDKKLWKHPAIKPLSIVKNLIFNSSIEENIVLDCFSGSGTTAIASIQLNRNFIAIENNPKHYKASLERLYSEISQIKLPIMKGGLYAV